jgi:mannose/fructose/N-acetylgalactosamine-specific phosphotransferase system component IID
MARKKFSEKFSLLNFIYRIMPEIKRYYSTEKEKSNGLLSQCSGFTQGIF